MMDLSIIMNTKDEDRHVIDRTLKPLLEGIEGKDAEIIINDNSQYVKHFYDHHQIRHLRNQKNIGVGGGFNKGVEHSRSEFLVLLGCDTVVQDDWYDRVLQTLNDHPNTIFNAASSGFTHMSEPFRQPRAIRYGAHLLYKMTIDDLPTHSALKKDKKFSRILQGKWNPVEPDPGEELGAITCLMGAFYWMHKSDYIKLRGWNHHKMWGSLESWISIKARAHGMQLLVDKRLEAAHYFGREIVRPSRADYQYFNMLFIAHTMFHPEIAQELEYHLRYGGRETKIEKLQVNNARVMLKRMGGAVKTERDYNNRHFKEGLIRDIRKFNIL